MFLHSQAELALGSRFKAVSEALYRIANEVYAHAGVDLDAHAFPLLRYLQVTGPGTVTDIATAIGQTHSAVSQMASKLQRGGWIARRSDRADARRSVLDLTAGGEERLGTMGPVWRAIRRAARNAAAATDGGLVASLDAFEARIASGELQRDALAQLARLRAAQVTVVPFRSEWREHFGRINAEWLERYWSLEAIDKRVLSQPEKEVIAAGGAIFFALLDGEVIGTVAMLKASAGVYELSKMGVETGFRGIGAGRRLLAAVIAEFHRRRGRMLFLESNSKLTPALTLYASMGFVHQPTLHPDSHYERSDVYMIYDGKAARNPVVRRRAANKTASMTKRVRGGRA
jgi:DNA-binding MarR family transcriptional regulator/GNAT superfamily N-acetyltransferase